MKAKPRRAPWLASSLGAASSRLCHGDAVSFDYRWIAECASSWNLTVMNFEE